MARAPVLSIIIPTLNEGEHIASLVEHLQQQCADAEILVADGGSTDDTVDRARAAGARLVIASRGRGAQMNCGARQARAEILLFLHADCGFERAGQLPSALGKFTDARTRSCDVAGHFGLRFVDKPAGYDRLFRFMEAKTRSGRRGTINGDQGLLIHRDYFSRLGGFDESLPFLEDQRIAAKIFDSGKWILLPGTLQTSARRFVSEGPFQRYAMMALIMSLHDNGLEDMIADLPQLYVEQSRTRTLQLEPIAREVRRRLLRELSANPKLALRVGQFVRDNLWQLAFMLDINSGEADAGPWTRRFDRGLRPHLDHPAAELLAAVGGAGGLLVLWPLFERARTVLVGETLQ